MISTPEKYFHEINENCELKKIKDCVSKENIVLNIYKIKKKFYSWKDKIRVIETWQVVGKELRIGEGTVKMTAWGSLPGKEVMKLFLIVLLVTWLSIYVKNHKIVC